MPPSLQAQIEIQETLFKHKKNLVYCKGGQTMAAHRGCRVSILGDIQNLTGHSPERPCWPYFDQQDWTRCSQEVLSNLSDSVMPLTLSSKILGSFQPTAVHNPSELVRHSVFLLCGERMGEDNEESLQAKADKFWDEADTDRGESKRDFNDS